jgi:glycolate oxidase iron-sulfur subunit
LSALELHDRLLTLADQCVMCALCLPHCPTFRLEGREMESPRGRISLIQALARNAFDDNRAAIAALDSCLLCRACERICPSEVAYGELMSTARRWLAPEWPQPLRAQATHWLLNHNPLPLPTLSSPAMANLSAAQQRRRIGLYGGCTATTVDRTNYRALLALLYAFGCEVVESPRGACCGARHHHQGQYHPSEGLAALGDCTAIVTINSACDAHLLAKMAKDLPPLFEADHLLASLPWPEDLSPLPLDAHALLHLPCSRRNGRRSDLKAITTLLAHIPELSLTPLDGNDLCCGGAGDYPLRHPAIADRLREAKWQAVREQQGNLLLSPNIGCSRHLATGGVEVLHPLTLLARQCQLI